ncbi:MAG: CBS domain-containing protein [Betaproteobacteria bacterium]
MKTARELLSRRPTGIVCVDPDDDVLKTLVLMSEKHIGAVLVMRGEKLVGILSERDYARKVEVAGRTARETRVRDIMTSNVLFVNPEHTVDQCMTLMTEKRIRHLPVLENERVVGILSNRDLVEAVVAEQQQKIRGLELERLQMTTDTY